MQKEKHSGLFSKKNIAAHIASTYSEINKKKNTTLLIYDNIKKLYTKENER